MTDKKRVLFLDDDERVLAGLRAVLRKHRRVLQMEFETSPRRACERLREERFDVLVTDMRMPEMDGSEVLQFATENAPHTARVVLSGHADTAAAVRAMHFSHQYLSKPCDPARLRSVLDRAAKIHELLDSESIRALTMAVSELPSLPSIYQRLCATLSDPQCDAQAIGRVIQSDMGLTTGLLRLVNSPYFRRGAAVTNIERAVSLMGVSRIRDLVLTSEVFEIMNDTCVDPRLELSRRMDRSFARAQVAQGIAPRSERDEAYLAALLADVGLVVLALQPGGALADVLDRSEALEDLAAAELEVLGVTHGAIGANLLSLWGLPYAVVHAVAAHQREQPSAAADMNASVAVRAAHLLTAPDVDEEALAALAESVGADAAAWTQRAERLRDAA